MELRRFFQENWCYNVVYQISDILMLFSGNTDNRWGVLHESSAGVGVWSSVWNAVLSTGDRNRVDEYHVVSVSVQWQRDVQWQDNGLCIRLQVSQLHHWYFHLHTEG